MRVLLQRVASASVTVEGETVGRIGSGILLLVGFTEGDDEAAVEWMASKCAQLRIFEDELGKMNRSALDLGLEALVVSQFTLYGDPSKGNRPSFVRAARPEQAIPLYERFVERLGEVLGRPVPTGRFGAHMRVALENDGPVTLWLER